MNLLLIIWKNPVENAINDSPFISPGFWRYQSKNKYFQCKTCIGQRQFHEKSAAFWSFLGLFSIPFSGDSAKKADYPLKAPWGLFRIHPVRGYSNISAASRDCMTEVMSTPTLTIGWGQTPESHPSGTFCGAQTSRLQSHCACGPLPWQDRFQETALSLRGRLSSDWCGRWSAACASGHVPCNTVHRGSLCNGSSEMPTWTAPASRPMCRCMAETLSGTSVQTFRRRWSQSRPDFAWCKAVTHLFSLPDAIFLTLSAGRLPPGGAAFVLPHSQRWHRSHEALPGKV